MPQGPNGRVKGIVGMFREVAAVEGAVAEVQKAGRQGGAVVERAGDVGGQAGQGGRREPRHPLAPKTRCSRSVTVPVCKPGSVGQQVEREVRHLVHRQEALQGLAGGGPCLPVRAVAEDVGLHLLLAGGRDPAHVDAVHADAVGEVGVGGVACQGLQRALGGGVDGEVGRAAMGVDRLDVDDAARCAPRRAGGGSAPASACRARGC